MLFQSLPPAGAEPLSELDGAVHGDRRRREGVTAKLGKRGDRKMAKAGDLKPLAASANRCALPADIQTPACLASLLWKEAEAH